MPKKWVREARRKAREDAYRAVTAETHAAIREEQRADKAPLPVYRSGPIRWRQAGTVQAYLRSLLEWADEARDFLLNAEMDSKSIPVPESVAAVSALRLAVTDWVVRASKVRVIMKHQDAFFLNERFRMNLYLIVTTRITHVGNTSLETEHEIRVTDPKSARQHGELIAIVAGTIIPIDPKTISPVTMSPAAKEYLTNNVLVQGDLRKPFEFPQPESPAVSGLNKATVRKSDCDAFEHLNNCTALDLFTDALSFAQLKCVSFYSIEFPTSLKAGDAGSVAWNRWENVLNGIENWFWIGDLTTESGGEVRRLKAAFTSFWPEEIVEEEQDNLPQPLTMELESEGDDDIVQAVPGSSTPPLDARM